jgi:hypothetical protein
MSKRLRSELSASALIGLAIVASTWIAVHAGARGWSPMASPLLLCVAFAVAELCAAHFERRAPRWLMLASTCTTTLLLAAALLQSRDESGLLELLPVLGAAGWVALLFPGHGASQSFHCRSASQ